MNNRCTWIAQEISCARLDDWCNLPEEKWRDGQIFMMNLSPLAQQHCDRWAGAFERG